MVSLDVEVITGHYRSSGSVESMGLAKTYPIAPPSTIIGFLDSLCGSGNKSYFREGINKLAYGYLRAPLGIGTIVRLDSVWAKVKAAELVGLTPADAKMLKASSEKYRPTKRETLWGLKYRIVVEGDLEDRIRQYLAGDDQGTGGLWLGESNNMVLSVVESVETTPVRWISPDPRGTLRMPTWVPHGFANRNSTMERFRFSEATEEPTGWAFQVSKKL